MFVNEFLKKYIWYFKFQSIDTNTFLVFLKRNLPGIENKFDLDVWVDGIGIPPDVMEPISTIHKGFRSVPVSSQFLQKTANPRHASGTG